MREYIFIKTTDAPGIKIFKTNNGQTYILDVGHITTNNSKNLMLFFKKYPKN